MTKTGFRILFAIALVVAALEWWLLGYTALAGNHAIAVGGWLFVFVLGLVAWAAALSVRAGAPLFGPGALTFGGRGVKTPLTFAGALVMFVIVGGMVGALHAAFGPKAAACATPEWQSRGGVDLQAAMNDRDGRRLDLLEDAIRQDRVRNACFLLAIGADPASSPVPLLVLSAERGRLESVKLLLAHGAPLDGIDSDGNTALAAAAWGGHEVVVAALLAANADTEVRNEDGRTALEIAREGGHADVVRRIEDAVARRR